MRLLLSVTDTATPAFQSVRTGLGKRTQMNNAAAAAALPVVQRNFLALSRTNHNQFGVRSSFWNRMNSGTYAYADETAGYIRMPREVALRYFGGTVTPKKAKFLAIPARAEAYNKSPRDFTFLRFALLDGKPALIESLRQSIKFGADGKVKRGRVKGAPVGKETTANVYYWLVRSATIKGNPSVLPPLPDVAAAAAKGMTRYLLFLSKGGKS